jgi:molybdopterin converting factor small subunit
MIKVELYAAFAEFAGTRQVMIPYQPGITCGDIWKVIQEKFPKLSPIPPLFAIGKEYIPRESALKDGDTVLLFPPVSGG